MQIYLIADLNGEGWWVQPGNKRIFATHVAHAVSENA
jgi:hypothetical protein